MNVYEGIDMRPRFSCTSTLSLVFFLVLGMLPPDCYGKSQVRTALVIGNGSYQSAPLRNPVNDARDMAAVLARQGFTVIHRENADRGLMRSAIREFEEILAREGGIGLFYYAGHGVQLQGKNYLVPVGADIQREYEVPDETIPADLVLKAMAYAQNELNIIILDACRNNPFPRSFRSASRGLARMETMGSGMLIAYATAPGSIASDGEGTNGIYTKYLLDAMQSPGLSIEQVFKAVRQKVMQETNNTQTPWEESSLTGDFYFIATDNARIEINTLSPADAALAEAKDSKELVFWHGISASKNAADYGEYLRQYPEGVFSELARSRLQELTSAVNGMDSGRGRTAGGDEPQAQSTGMAAAISGVWRHEYMENNRTNYLQYTFVDTGEGSAEGEEPDGSWWSAPFTWSISDQVLTLQYRENSEQFQIVSVKNAELDLLGVSGEVTGDRLLMNRQAADPVAPLPSFSADQLIGTWRETWEEGGQEGYQVFTIRSDGTILDRGRSADEQWSQETGWRLNGNILQLQNEEQQQYRIVRITSGYLDLIDLSPENRGDGSRLFKVTEIQ